MKNMVLYNKKFEVVNKIEDADFASEEEIENNEIVKIYFGIINKTKKENLNEGWLTTDDGRHIFIDDKGDAHTGKDAIDASKKDGLAKNNASKNEDAEIRKKVIDSKNYETTGDFEDYTITGTKMEKIPDDGYQDHKCYSHSLQKAKKEDNYDLDVGVIIDKNELAKGEKVGIIEHSWNVNKNTGEIADFTLGDKWGSEHVYFGKIVNKNIVKKMKNSDDVYNIIAKDIWPIHPGGVI